MGALGGASAQQVFGGRGAGNFLTKTTWVTASIFFVTSITLAFLSSSTDDSLAERAKQAQVDRAPSKAPAEPDAPASNTDQSE
jgi:preprotein translocase subunit SecG